MDIPSINSKLEKLTLAELGRRLDLLEARVRALEATQATPEMQAAMAHLTARVHALLAIYSGRQSR